ncbi:MAG: hypothetical protein HDR04_17645 [Lachnospiraceae bacterium]|nr:hypothetical protein [Lachnospiraceae bacterium]
MSSPKVCQILEWQNGDGYFGTRLHTAPTGSMIHPINSEYNEQYGFWWFHFHELAARMGMLSEKTPFRKNFDLIDDTQHRGETQKKYIDNYYILV